jgi:predicted  nucleic acid-binding Zn-ribbon protein
MNEKVRALEEEVEELKGQNSSLRSQLQELSLKTGRLL